MEANEKLFWFNSLLLCVSIVAITLTSMSDGFPWSFFFWIVYLIWMATRVEISIVRLKIDELPNKRQVIGVDDLFKV